MSGSQRDPDRIPLSTFRFQMHEGFTFEDAALTVPYLETLGITDCYLSPILAAGPHSTHGYDICDHNRINPALGGEAGLTRFASALQARSMGLIVDFVPNHMGIDVEANLWWRDVLESGPSSPYARFFDIDWNPVKQELRGKLLLPILADQYGVTLHSGELQVEFREGKFALRYLDHNLPLNPRALPLLLRNGLNTLQTSLPDDDPGLNEFLSILFHLDHLPAYTQSDSVSIVERQREKEVAKRRLEQLVETSEPIRRHIEDNVRHINGTPGDLASFDLLHTLLEAQVYRLSFWRTAMHEINYRRFFDINELAGIRIEDADVFAAAHGLLLRFIHEGKITGVRLDHVDGLFDPARYFQMLEERCGPERHIYVIAEKILSDGEDLTPNWAIHGTTGYDFLNSLNGVFLDSRNFREFAKLYARFTGMKRSFRDIVYASKKLIVTTSMASELKVLAAELNRISESNRHFRDFTLDSIQAALAEVVACFPIYRTYFSEQGCDEFDRVNVDLAIQDALRRNPAMESSAFAFIRQMLLPERLPDVPEGEHERRVRFAMKFQQYTGPVQAKGVEDTAFYRYGPVLSLNEVGGNPGRLRCDPAAFHDANRGRLRDWPLSMLATTTHDTKRGEDARARLNVLSEMPDEWRDLISRCSRINSSARTLVQGEPAPDRSDEYLFYQTLVGAWPSVGETPDREFVDRIRAYMSKATKEKKVRTSWINPSKAYDEAMGNFVERTLTGTRSEPFLRAFLPFQRRVARHGVVNSLSQLILKIASPGVPDFYQGSELWDFSLVDPDNRRPVDFELRRQTIKCLLPLFENNCPTDTVVAAVSEMLENWFDGRVKQYVTAAGLRLRHQHGGLFIRGKYIALGAIGEKKDHVIALARTDGELVVIAIAPRLPVGISSRDKWPPLGQETWLGTEIEIPAEWSSLRFLDVLTSRSIFAGTAARTTILLADALRICPVALLVARGGEGLQ